jgi:hypothetical protein
VLRGSEGDLHLAMEVVAERSGYRGVLTVRRAGREPERRAMTGERCGEVVEALALTAALSIDPEATLTLGAPSEESNEAEAAPPRSGDAQDAEEDSSAAVESRPSGDADVAWFLGPALAVERVMDHALHGGGRVVLVASAPGGSVFPLEARVSFDALMELSPAPEPSVVTRLVAVRPAYCPLRTTGVARLSLCAFARVGALTAEGRGWEAPERTTRFFAGAGAEAWLRVPVARSFELWLSPAWGVPLTERRFAVSPGPEVVAATAPMSWSLSAGGGWAL